MKSSADTYQRQKHLTCGACGEGGGGEATNNSLPPELPRRGREGGGAGEATNDSLPPELPRRGRDSRELSRGASTESHGMIFGP